LTYFQRINFTKIEIKLELLNKKQPSLFTNIVKCLKDVTRGQDVKYFTEDHYSKDENNDVMEFVEIKSLDDSGMTCTNFFRTPPDFLDSQFSEIDEN
jgi:hypothetical protein